MSSSNEPSTIQSYIDSATGTLQSALGSLTGSTADQHAGESKQDKAALEHDASHAALKVGNVTASSSGAVTKDDPRRTEGSWNQTVGAGKEFVGNVVGSQDLKRDGHEQNLAGKGQEAEGQLSDFGSGVQNRVAGAVGAGFAGLTGDKEAQIKAQDRHDVGKTQQRGAEIDIQKQNS